jgi:hypothetical protein
MPHKVWAVGEEVLAAGFNQYVQEQVIATFANAAARATAIPAPKDGQHTWLIDVERLEVWDGESWRPTSGAPHTSAVRHVFAVENAITNPFNFTPLPQAASRTALTITFTKYAPDTNLILQGTAQWAVSSGVITQRFQFGLRRDAGGAGLDVQLTNLQLTTNQGVTAPFRLYPQTGLAVISGLAAGTYVFQPIVAASGGVVINFYPGDDWISYSVTETY